MKIEIHFDSSWQNKFLDGDNMSPIPKKGRKFMCSSKNIKDNLVDAPISKNTVLGVLCRLIGDQRKLYQSIESDDFYFNDIQGKINFEVIDEQRTNELVYLRNMNGHPDPTGVCGYVDIHHPSFSDHSIQQFWDILYCDVDTLSQYILDQNTPIPKHTATHDLDSIKLRYQTMSTKYVNDDNVVLAAHTLEKHFDLFGETDGYFKNGAPNIKAMYCGALYIKRDHMIMDQTDVSLITSSEGVINGISKRNFCAGDLEAKFASGGRKKIYGSPCLAQVFVTNEKGKKEKIIKKLNKVSGTLIIELDIPKERSSQLIEMIQNAGVSTFSLGKKGLAFVKSMRA